MPTRVLSALSLATCLTLACKPAGPTPDAPEPAPAPASDARPEAPAPAGPETWVGAVEVPGLKLRFVARLAPPPDPKAPRAAWSGRLDIPAQSVKDFALKDVRVAPEGLEFILAPPGAPENQWAFFTFERGAGAADARGELSQAGQTFPSTMRRLAPGEEPDVEPKRPQEPRPPFPYAAREAAFASAAADRAALAGTLTLPQGTGPFPALVLLTGSGAQDRDEAIMGHRPFLVLADHLTRAGFAVLRYDDRGVGGSKGDLNKATQSDLAGDARGALDWLAAQPEIDKKRLGLLGHSEGAMIAAKAAAADKRVAALIMLAGPGVTGAELLPQQLAAIARTSGSAQVDIDAQLVLQKELLAALLAGKPRADLEELLRKLVLLQTPTARRPQETAALVTASLMSLDTPWFRDFLRADPRADLRKLKKTPVLALIGGLDLQVPADANLPQIERALQQAGNKAFVAKTLPGKNHLFQTAKTGSPGEYGEIEETMSPDALAEITTWLRGVWP